jgi:hypothetical protein
LSVGDGAAALFAVCEALEVCPASPGVDVAAGTGAGSLLAFGLFPQPVENASRAATIMGNRSFFIMLEIKCFPPKRESLLY